MEIFIIGQHVQPGPSTDLRHNDTQVSQPALPQVELESGAGQLARGAVDIQHPNGDFSALGPHLTSHADGNAQGRPMQPPRESEHHSMQNGSGSVGCQPVYGPMPAPADYHQQHHQVQTPASP